MIKPEAVIFDMDGVLIDSEPIHIEIENKLFDKLGIAVSAEVHRNYLGVAGDYMYQDLKTRFGLPGSLSELLHSDDAFRCDYFRQLEGLTLNEGVLNFILEIKQAGLKLGVATSSSPALAAILLERCDIFSFFDVVVTTFEAGKSKPFPDVYLLAAQKIGVEPADCIVFEDSPNGLSAARGAGMFTIAVQTSSVDVRDLLAANSLICSFEDTSLLKITRLFSGNHSAELSIK